MTAVLRCADGAPIELDSHRWFAELDAVELDLLGSLPDPLLDIGCGPGRVGAALAASGRRVLGVDVDPEAVASAKARGGAALERSVFEPLPGEGRWGAAVLLDGNIGIGGDPAGLLARVHQLLRPGGEVVVEVLAPDEATLQLTVRVEAAGGRSGPWFPWARVGAGDFSALACRAGLRRAHAVCRGGRWFGRAMRP